MKERDLHYGDYLQLERLLDCQRPLSGDGGPPAHDEMLFIVVHQAYELWFKQILHELEAVRALFRAPSLSGSALGRAVMHLRRVVEIQALLIQQVRVIETMTPLDFLDFRDVLFPASGAQSVQFRLVENTLGLRRPRRVDINGMPYTAPLREDERQRIERSEAEPSLFDLVDGWLGRTPFLRSGEFDFVREYAAIVSAMFDRERERIDADPRLGATERAERMVELEKRLAGFRRMFDGEEPPAAKADGRRLSRRALQAALMINLYRDEPHLQIPYRFLTVLMDVDEGFTEWRYRHAQMVSRMIGSKLGTGGTTGNHYLLEAAQRHGVFEDLFELSTYLIPRSVIPALPREVKAMLGFQYGE